MYFYLTRGGSDHGDLPITPVSQRYMGMPARVHPLLSKERIEELYFREGLSMPKIAEMEGVPYSLVRASFKAHGLTWRTKSEARSRWSHSDETKRKIAVSRTGQKDTPEVAARKKEILARAGAQGWNRGLTAETDERVARQRDAATKVMRTPEWREKKSRQMADRISQGGYYDKGYYESSKAGRAYYMSGWELRRWKELDADPTVVRWERHPCHVSYEWKGIRRLYLPDVLITYEDGTVVLEEIKPLHIVQDARKKQNRIAAKLAAGAQYAQGHNWEWRIFSYLKGRNHCIFT